MGTAKQPFDFAQGRVWPWYPKGNVKRKNQRAKLRNRFAACFNRFLGKLGMTKDSVNLRVPSRFHRDLAVKNKV